MTWATPKRALIRSYRREYVRDGARFAVTPLTRETEQATPVLSGDACY
ncbi:MAG: hypothetical protein WHX52_15465 [Anaerolineae bacterium]